MYDFTEFSCKTSVRVLYCYAELPFGGWSPQLSSKGGDAYDYMDRDIHLLSCVDRSSFLVEKQVERKKAAPDKDGQTLI